MSYVQDAVNKIEMQQAKLKESEPAFCVGEQLKEMLEGDEKAAEIVAQDLDVEAMSLRSCEKKIKEWVDKNHTGNVGCCTPKKAEEIIRAFYGIEKGNGAQGKKAAPAGKTINLLDLM